MGAAGSGTALTCGHGGCFTSRHCREPQRCPGRDAGRGRPGQAVVDALQVGLECGDAQGRRHSLPSQKVFRRLLKAVLVMVALKAMGCVESTPLSLPGPSVPSPCRHGRDAKCREGSCLDPHHPHQVLLIHWLSCTSQASFNVACLSLFELLFGIKQNNQRFVMFLL